MLQPRALSTMKDWDVSLVAQQKASYNNKPNIEKAKAYGHHRSIRFDNGERGYVATQLTDSVLEHGLNHFRDFMVDIKNGKQYQRGENFY